MSWQPMKTAPKDGTVVYVTVAEFGARCTMAGHYSDAARMWVCDGRYTSRAHIVAWMPLPISPMPYDGPVEDLSASHDVDPRDAEIERLRAEIERLRNALPSDVVKKDIDYLLSCIDGHPNVADEYERVSEWLASLENER